MIIEINNLVRHFGKVKAVDGVSFTFGTGEVVGLSAPTARARPRPCAFSPHSTNRLRAMC